MKSFSVISDLQLDSYTRLSSLLSSGATTRLMDILSAVRWAADCTIQQGIKDLIVCGDVFDDRSSIDLSVIDSTCRLFAELSEKLNVWILAGNHDSYLRHPGFNSLQMFRGLAQVRDAPQVDGEWAFVPWVDDLDTYRGWIDIVSQNSDAKILFTHLLLDGVAKGKGAPVDILRPDRWDWIFLGDVHDPCVVRDNALYTGGLCQIDFRDAGGERGFYVFDGKKPKYVHNTLSPKFHVVTDQAPPARKGDFVRVKSGDVGKAAELAQKCRAAGMQVECIGVAEENAESRINVGLRDSHEENFRRYARFVQPDMADEELDQVTKEAMEIIEAVK